MAKPTSPPTPRRRRSWIPWVACVALAALGLAGWLRPSSDGPESELEAAVDPEDLEAVREQAAAAGFAERVRIVNRLGQLGRLGGAGATQSLIELLHGARTQRVRLAAIKQLGLLATPEAVSELTEVAQSGHRRLRGYAVRALGQAGTARAVTFLLELLEQEQRGELRDDVIAALGDAGGERAVAQLIELAQDRKEPARSDAIGALGATGSAAALPALKKLLADRLPEIRADAVAALGELGSSGAQQELGRLIDASGTPSELRVKAVEALEDFAGDVVQARLAALVQDGDPAVAKAALQTLAKLDGPIASRALHGALRSGSSALRAEAAEALADSGDPAGVPALVRQLHGERYPYWVARQLAAADDPKARQALLDAVATGKGNAAEAAISALEEVKGPQIDRALRRAMKSASPDVAKEALEALAKRQGTAALPMLRETLRSGSNTLRGAAMEAIAELGDPSARPLLLNGLRSTDRTTASAAVKGLVKLEGRKAEGTLLEIMKSGTGMARSYAIDALAELNTPRARESLIKSLSSKDFHVSYSAGSALAKLRHPEVQPRLRRMLEDPGVSADTKERILSVYQDTEDRASLIAATKNASDKVAGEALEALGKTGGAAAERTLADAVMAGKQERRAAAIKGLAELGTPGAIQSLGQALQEPKLLGEATEALVSIGSQEAMRAVRDRYLAADDKERLTIIEKLGDEPNPWGQELLDTAVASADTKLAAAAGTLLAKQLGVDEAKVPQVEGASGLVAELQQVRAKLQLARRAMEQLERLR